MGLLPLAAAGIDIRSLLAGASERKNSNFSGIFNMLIKILLIVAIVIQTIATLYAIRLIRTTKYLSLIHISYPS